MMYFSALNKPKSPLYLKPVKAELNRSVVNVETIAQKKICQESFMFQKLDTSSMENSKPPTGAPNAEATPAAAPALMKLRLGDAEVWHDIDIVESLVQEFKSFLAQQTAGLHQKLFIY